MIERTAEQWLECIEEGPDEEEHECRGCYHFMRAAMEDRTEPTPLCDSCAQTALEVIATKYKETREELQRIHDNDRNLDI